MDLDYNILPNFDSEDERTGLDDYTVNTKTVSHLAVEDDVKTGAHTTRTEAVTQHTLEDEVKRLKLMLSVVEDKVAHYKRRTRKYQRLLVLLANLIAQEATRTGNWSHLSVHH